MSNEKKSAPRRPDMEVDYCRGGIWDNRPDGGDLKVQLTISFKEIGQRLQEKRDEAERNEQASREREPGRQDASREPAREPAREDRRESARTEPGRSSREDRAPRDSGPRYER